MDYSVEKISCNLSTQHISLSLSLSHTHTHTHTHTHPLSRTHTLSLSLTHTHSLYTLETHPTFSFTMPTQQFLELYKRQAIFARAVIAAQPEEARGDQGSR